jgi:predicted O-methyltransferase YrrM
MSATDNAARAAHADARRRQRRERRAPWLVRLLWDEWLGFVVLWLRVWRTVPGWLDLAEARILYTLAYHGPGKGAIVEVGSAWGRSTLFLATAGRRAGREVVYAIDPHIWSTDSELEVSVVAPGSIHSTLPAFQKNIRRFGLDAWVVPVVSTSTEAARSLDTGPIRLLFIDALHDYESVKADTDAWLPPVIPGGIVVFDDYRSDNPAWGVQQAVDELVASGSLDPALRQVGKMVWTTRR